MKVKSARIFAYCLALGLILALTLSAAGCSGATTTSTPTLSTISVAPFTPSDLAVGSTQQFAATAIYTDGTTPNITSQATWESSSPDIATISASGLATGVAVGTTDITATLAGKISPVISLTVVAASATLSSIMVTPANPADIAVGGTQHFTATGTYSDGSTADITTQVSWVSSSPSTVTILATGAATGVAGGTADITAALSGVTSTPVTLTVISLSSIAVTPNNPANLPVGGTQHFTATGTYSNGLTADLTTQVSWGSSILTTATIFSSGIATGLAAGTTTITASLSGITGPPVTLTVISLSSLSSIMIIPLVPASLSVGITEHFSAIGIYSDGTTADITSQAVWISSSPAIATIFSNGIATGVAAGATNITAALSGITSPAETLTVTSISLTSVKINPASPANLMIGSTQRFTAIGFYSDGSTVDITLQVNWTSSNNDIASILSNGTATGSAAGTTNIKATLSGITSQPVTLTVISLPSLFRIIILPVSSAVINVGATMHYTAVGIYLDGSTIDITSQVNWTSSDDTVAFIFSGGSATGVTAGITYITAASGGVTSATVILTVISH